MKKNNSVQESDAMNIKICFKSDWMIHSERCPTTGKRSVIGFNTFTSNKKTSEKQRRIELLKR